MATGEVGSSEVIMGGIGQLREFHLNITDWNIYKARLNNYFIANEVTSDNKKRAILLNMLDEESYKLIFNICSPDVPELNTFDMLISLLDKHFIPRKSVLAERFKFFDSKKGNNETIKDWAARVRSLAVSCEFGMELDICLRDRFVCGFEKGIILDRLLEEKKDITFEQAIGIAENKMASSQSYQIGNSVKMEQLLLVRSHVKRHESGRHFNSQKGSSASATNGGTNDKCTTCGKIGHNKDKCFRNLFCSFCKKNGHNINNCFKKKKRMNNVSRSHNYLQDENDNYENEPSLFVLNNANSQNNAYSLEVKLGSCNILFLVDTGASISCISENLYLEKFRMYKLKQTDRCLTFYNGIKVEPLGILNTNVEFKRIVTNMNFYVFKNGGPPILGRDFLNIYNIGFSNLNFMNERINIKTNALINQFSNLFSEGVGLFNKSSLSLKLKNTNVTPKFHKARPIPYALKSPVEAEINRLLSLGIISPVDYSQWGTPVVPVLKKNGAVRLCGDYKVTINPHIEIDQHPLPRIEDLFGCLQGGVQFSKLDLSDAYQQVGLNDDSKKLTTIVTHKGLFIYNRLTYGIASAPSKFQKLMESLLSGIDGVTVFLDDILITGKDEKEHFNRLKLVLSILENSGLKLSISKCKFFQDSIEYLGYKIDREGLHTSENKVAAILKVQKPNNITELKSFLGMVNYYGKFIRNISSILCPLHRLLRKDVKWFWSKDCDQAFDRIKLLLSSTEVLVHFNPELDIRLTVDASSRGLGAILSHQYPSGIEKPIAYASRSLSKSEKNYSQIEREGLAIIFGVHKFHQYLYAKKFKLITDNKPLMTIFGQNKPIPQFSANRLRRWAVILSNYQYEVEYVKSENNTADALSRLSESDSLSNNDDVEFPYCNFLTNSEEMPINLDVVERETADDKGLSQVIEFMKIGWPKYISNDMIKPYFSRRSEFAVSNKCLFWNHRIVVPVKLRHVFLKTLHMTHFGIVKSKNIARAHFWWPNLDKDIENYVKRCESCRKNLSNPAKVPLATWSWPGEVWERLHIDYFGPFSKKYYLIILDAHSKWVEVFETSTTSSEATIKMLRSCFARFGLPKTVVSDNATYFTSEQFEFFLKKNNIKHVLIPPYHPESNGAAENCVKTVKNGIKKAMSEKTSVDTNTVLSRFLFDYRTTEHCTTGVSPAQIMFGRNLRTRFNALLYKPSKELANKVHCKQLDQKKYYKGKNSIDYQVNDLVLVKDYRDVNKTNWIKGKIRKKIGRVTFLVHILELDRCWKRHANQLRKTSENIVYPSERIVSNFEQETKNENVFEGNENVFKGNENVFESNENVFKSNENVILDKTDRPKRVRKPPERFQAE